MSIRIDYTDVSIGTLSHSPTCGIEVKRLFQSVPMDTNMLTPVHNNLMQDVNENQYLISPYTFTDECFLIICQIAMWHVFKLMVAFITVVK